MRLPTIAHSTSDTAGFLPGLIALAQDKGFAGYSGDGANLWGAVHIRDVAALARLALEKGPAGRYLHAVEDGGVPFREIAEAIGSSLGVPMRAHGRADVLPGYFGMFTNLVTLNLPALEPDHPPDPGLGSCAAQTIRRSGQRPLLLRPTGGLGVPMTTFAFLSDAAPPTVCPTPPVSRRPAGEATAV